MGQDEKEKLQEQIKEEEVKPTEGTSSPVLDKTIKADLQESMQDIKPLSSERLDEVSRQLKDDKREFVEGGYAVDGYFVADDSLSRNEATEVSETSAPSPTPEPVPAPAETPARVESTAAQETPAATANPAPETNTPTPVATSRETPAETVTPAAASVPETQEQAPVAETTPASVATPAATTEQETVPTPAATAQTNPPAATTSAAGSSQPAPATETTDTTETTETTTAATSPSDIYSETKKYLEEENEKQKQNIRDIYQNEIGGYDKLYEEAMKRKEAFAAMDKERSKKESAYRYITGVGDLMSGFANLVGTANYASNQDQTYLAPELVKKAEAARKERKLEMQKLNARLEEMRARKDALATQRDTKLAELDAKLVSDVYKANMQKAQDERMINIQGLKGQVEDAKIAGRIAVAETKAANSLNNTRLRIRTNQAGKVKNATFYDEDGKPQVLNVYSVEDVGAEVIKAVNANKGLWSTEEQTEYKDAVNKATLAASYGGDGGEALEIFYEKMQQKPYVYEHFKRLVGGTTSRTTTTSTTTTSGGSSVDSALEGL